MRSAIARSGIVLVFAALLQSCGGGGGGNGDGGDPPSPPAGGLVALTEPKAIDTGILVFGPAENALQAMQLLADAAWLLNQQLLVPQQFACTQSGQVRLSARDNDNNSVLSAGDRVVITYTDCDQTRGTVELAITQIGFTSGQVTSVSGSVSLDIDFQDSPGVTLTSSGQLTFTATSNQLHWLGTAFSVHVANATQSEGLSAGRIEKTITSPGLNYSITIAGTFDSDSLGGRFSYTTNQPFTGTEAFWPSSGLVTATGRNNSKITFTPSPSLGRLNFQVDADGDGQFEVTPQPLNWSEIADGLLFGVTEEPTGPPPPPPPPPPDAFGRRIVLGAPGEDLVADNARGRIYVTVPNRNELVVISAQTLEVQRRVIVGPRPKGMSLSLDGEELFVGLGAAGSIAIVDLDTFAISQIFVATELGTSSVYEVVETSPGILYASSGTDNIGWIVRVDRAAGTVTRLGYQVRLYEKGELIADPAHGLLYAGDGFGTSPESLYKIDASNPSSPLLLEDVHGTIGGTRRMHLDPTGTRIYLSSGQVVNTSDFADIGRIHFGTPWAVDNGTDVIVGEGAGMLRIHSAADFREIDTLTTDCNLGAETHYPPDVDRIAPSPVDGQWLMLGADIFCAVDLLNPTVAPGTGQPGIPPGQPPTLTVPVIDLSLGAEAFDAEFDFSRNRIYVSLPATGEVVTVDAATHQVAQRDPLGNAPRGLDLSPDGSTLAIMFNGNGHIGYQDLATGLTQTTDLTPFLFSPEGHDVAYVSDDAIFASSNQPSGQAHLVKTSRLDPAATLRVTGGDFLRDRPELAASPDGIFLYATERDQDLHKFDLRQPDAPLILEGAVNNYFGADRVSLSPDGNRIALRNGQVLRTVDFTQAGQVGTGIPLFSRSGTFIYAADAPGRIDRYDASSYVPTQTIQGNCSIGQPRRLLANASENTLITVGQSRLCFWFLSGQVTSSIKVGPQSTYVCGSDCLVRQYHKLLESRSRHWKRQPVTATR